jgi:hypothetical protein
MNRVAHYPEQSVSLPVTDQDMVDPETGMPAPAQVLVGIETDCGPWVNALIAAGYQVLAINSAVSRRGFALVDRSGRRGWAGDGIQAHRGRPPARSERAPPRGAR